MRTAKENDRCLLRGGVQHKRIEYVRLHGEGVEDERDPNNGHANVDDDPEEDSLYGPVHEKEAERKKERPRDHCR
jgi:hypothetical protein